MKNLGYFFVFLLVASCQTNHKTKPEPKAEASDEKAKEVLLRLEPSDNNPRNSEGDFIELEDGRLLFIYSHFTGDKGGDHDSAYLAGRYSGDGGISWSEDEVIVVNEDVMNLMSVSLLRLQNGEIALFYLRRRSGSDLIPLMRISTDEAETWSEPVETITDRKGYFVLNNDRVIKLENGRLVMPVSLHKTPDTEWSNVGRIFSYYSDDNGKSWQSSKEVDNPENVVLQEPGIVELTDGRIMKFMRTDEEVQYLSYSNDQGETWTTAEPSNIPSPLSPASIERIPSTGDLLLVWNNNDKNQKRTPFNSAISKDEGETWTYTRTIEEDPEGWYCYTSIHFTDEGVLLGYCAGNRPQGTGLAITNITRLKYDWIYYGEE